jgi:hypothetical protein
MASEHFSKTAAPTCEVRAIKVLSGKHRDASVVLGCNDLLVIGADESCDVCLSDAGLAARHAALAVHADTVSIRRLDGTVSVNGRELSAGISALLDNDSDIALGDSQVTLRIAATSHATGHWSPATSDMEMEPIHAQPVATRESVPAKASVWVKAPIVAVAVVVVTGIVMQQLQSSPADAAPPELADAKRAVPRGQDLAQQVREVFRANGYDAEVSDLGNGRVRVENLDQNHAQVRRVAALVRDDMPQLAALEFAAEPGVAPPAAAQYAQRLGGHLRPVVDGETAYVATPDDGRYFVGSVLPSGHTIRRITSTGAQVDRNGQISWIAF